MTTTRNYFLSRALFINLDEVLFVGEEATDEYRSCTVVFKNGGKVTLQDDFERTVAEELKRSLTRAGNGVFYGPDDEVDYFKEMALRRSSGEEGAENGSQS